MKINTEKLMNHFIKVEATQFKIAIDSNALVIVKFFNESGDLADICDAEVFNVLADSRKGG